MTVSSNSQFKTLEELIAFAKANPAKVNHAVPAVGEAGHLAFEQLRFDAKIPAVAIPSTSVAAATTDVIGGRVVQAHRVMWSSVIKDANIRAEP